MDRRSLLQQSCKIAGKRLPSEYARVEYLESTGTQWIDSGVQSGLCDAYLFDVEVNYITRRDYIIGEITYAKNLNTVSAGIELVLNGNSYMTFSFDYNVRHQIFTTDNNSKLYVDGVYLGGVSNSPSTSQNTLYIGKVRSASFGLKGKIYGVMFWEADNTLVRHFIPALRLSDMKPGLYDYITGQFYVNSGTGEFLYGPYIGPLPDVPGDYQKVEYIESTGEQYIDTGYAVVSENSSVEIKYQATSLDEQNIAIFGSQDNQYHASSLLFLKNQYGERNKYALRIYNQMLSYGTSNMLLNDINVSTGNVNGKTFVLKINNDVYSSPYPDTNINGVTLGLFADNHIGSPQYFASAKLYSCEISDNNALVRHFIPCYRKSDGEIGLFDLIKGVFYTNQGTGTFLKGPNI